MKTYAKVAAGMLGALISAAAIYLLMGLPNRHPALPAGQEADADPGRRLSHLFRTQSPAGEAYARKVAQGAGDPLEFGRYLVQDLFNCYACHSSDFRTNDVVNPEKSRGYLAGGNLLLDIDQNPIRAANITLDKETGIGNWSEDEFVRAMRTGIRPDGIPFRYPMTRYPELGHDAWRAVWAYLESVKPVRNEVERNYPDFDNLASRGEILYWKNACVSCHGESGKGVGDLTRVNVDFPHDSTLTQWIRNPSAFNPMTRMPAFDGVIPDEDFAPLVDYLRELSARAGTALR